MSKREASQWNTQGIFILFFQQNRKVIIHIIINIHQSSTEYQKSMKQRNFRFKKILINIRIHAHTIDVYWKQGRQKTLIEKKYNFKQINPWVDFDEFG